MRKVLYLIVATVLCIPTSTAHNDPNDLARNIYCNYWCIIDPAADYYSVPVPAEIIIAVIAVESGGNPRATAKPLSSARGLMQALSGTRKDIARWFGNPWFFDCDPFDPYCSIHQGAGYMRILKKHYTLTSWEQILFSYYHGPGMLSRSRSDWSLRSDPYVARVFRYIEPARRAIQAGHAECKHCWDMNTR